jgi:hypothetical protein
LCVNCTWPKVFHGQHFIRFWKYHYVKSLHGFLWDRHLINTITKYRKRSIQSQTTESLFLQRTQEQKPAISIVVSCLLSLVKTCLIHYSNMKQAWPWMLTNLKLVWQFHAHPVHQKASRLFGPRYIGDDFLLGPNLVSFNRTVVPYEISKVNFHVETKILVSMSEEI